MPTDLITDVGRTAGAFTIITVVAAPVAFAAWSIARFQSQPILSKWPSPNRTWTGFDVLCLFGAFFTLLSTAIIGLSSGGFFQNFYGSDFPTLLDVSDPDTNAVVSGTAVISGLQSRIEVANQVRFLWASVIAIPLLFVVAGILRMLNQRERFVFDVGRLPAQIMLGVLAWMILTPLALIVHLVSVVIASELGVSADEHPLMLLALTPGSFDVVLFGFVVCFATPLAEEFLFRGMLLSWMMRGRVRAYIVMFAAVLLAVAVGRTFESPPHLAAVTFEFLLAVGLVLIVSRVVRGSGRFPVRTVAAIHVSAALFAAAHAAVWPSPIPLYFLGLGLGWLTVRTGGIAASTVAHGLFNAVAFVILLRGGGN